jgi:hypothetical protein
MFSKSLLSAQIILSIAVQSCVLHRMCLKLANFVTQLQYLNKVKRS